MPTGTQNRQRAPRRTIGRRILHAVYRAQTGSDTTTMPAYTLPCIRQTGVPIGQRLDLQPTVRTGVIFQPHSGRRCADRFRVSNYSADFWSGRNKLRRPAELDLWQVRRGGRVSPTGVRRNPSAWAVPRIWL
jgi:hypothetical protein